MSYTAGVPFDNADRLPHPLVYEISAGGARRDKALETIKKAFRKHDGHRVRTAAELGVAPSTLTRWTSQLGLDTYVNELRAAAGSKGARLELSSSALERLVREHAGDLDAVAAACGVTRRSINKRVARREGLNELAARLRARSHATIIRHS